MNTLVTQISYNHWANLKLIDAASAVSFEALTQPTISSFPSIHQTLIHILWAETLWYERWQGQSFISSLDPHIFPTLEHIRLSFEDIRSKQLSFLLHLPASDANRLITYENFRQQKWEYPLRDMVQHLVLHSAYHRGQVATLLRQLNVVPPHTDFLLFVDTLPASSA